MNLQRLQNKVSRTIGKFTGNNQIIDMHNAFHIPYVYVYT
jgi:hypothetical protein